MVVIKQETADMTDNRLTHATTSAADDAMQQTESTTRQPPPPSTNGTHGRGALRMVALGES